MKPLDKVINWAEDLPEFCSWSLLLVAMILAQVGCVLLLLGQPGPWSWPALGLLSLFSLWAVVLIEAFWCITSRLLIAAVKRHHQSARPGKLGWSLCWILLWLEALVLCMGMAQCLVLIDRGAGLHLLNSQLEPARMVLTAGVIGALLAGVLLRYTAIWQRWQLQTRQQARMELQNLQARLRPHFLYNTLNSIAALIAQKPADAISAIENLSDLLRQSLQPTSRRVKLTHEIELCLQYLQLMQWRLGSRLQTRWNIAPNLNTDDWRIPPLTLQALVENAVLHGIQPLAEGGELVVRIAPQPHTLKISISNPLAPAASRDQASATGTGTALTDLTRRLDLVYQGHAHLTTRMAEQHYTVTLELPHG